MPFELPQLGPEETRNLLMEALTRLRGGQSAQVAQPAQPQFRSRADSGRPGAISYPEELGGMPNRYSWNGAPMDAMSYFQQLNYGSGQPGDVLSARIGVSPQELAAQQRPALEAAQSLQAAARADALKQLLGQLQQRIGGTPNSQPMTMASVLGNYRQQIQPMQNDLASLLKGF